VRIEANGARLFVDVAGAKLRTAGVELEEVPTVLIVHTGPGVDHLPYKEHIGPALAAVAQVVYVDLRGHGRSDEGSPDDWNTEVWAADLHALCECLAIDRPVVLGAGWGAYTALRLAARWPESVSKLVLVNPNARFVAQRAVAAFDELGGAEAGEAAFRFFDDPTNSTLGEFLRVAFPHVMGSGFATDALVRPEWRFDLAVHWSRTEMRTLDLRPELPSVSAPALVVAGGRDPQSPQASIDEVVAGLPDARVARYDNARHSVFRDAPECMAEIAEFVR
jgi:proline iminopeptidase